MGCAASSSSSKKPPPPPPLEEAAPAEPPPLRPKSGLYSSIAWPLRFARYALCPRVKSLLRSCAGMRRVSWVVRGWGGVWRGCGEGAERARTRRGDGAWRGGVRRGGEG